MGVGGGYRLENMIRYNLCYKASVKKVEIGFV